MGDIFDTLADENRRSMGKAQRQRASEELSD